MEIFKKGGRMYIGLNKTWPPPPWAEPDDVSMTILADVSDFRRDYQSLICSCLFDVEIQALERGSRENKREGYGLYPQQHRRCPVCPPLTPSSSTGILFCSIRLIIITDGFVDAFTNYIRRVS